MGKRRSWSEISAIPARSTGRSENRCRPTCTTSKESWKVTPYGVYDMAANTGWVSVGSDHDTGQFAVESIRRWWEHVGRPGYPEADRLLITADGGGSNGSRLRLWKRELADLATQGSR